MKAQTAIETKIQRITNPVDMPEAGLHSELLVVHTAKKQQSWPTGQLLSTVLSGTEH